MSDPSVPARPTLRDDRTQIAIGVAIGLSLLWLLACGAFFLAVGRSEAASPGVLIAVVLIIALLAPIALISLAVALAMARASYYRTLDELADWAEARLAERPAVPPQVRAPAAAHPDPKPALDAMAARVEATDARLAELEEWLAARAVAEARAAQAAPVYDHPVDTADDAAEDTPPPAETEEEPDEEESAEAPEQEVPQSGLDRTSDADGPVVPVDTYVAALQFPSDPDDTAGFDALRVALANRRAGALVTAAQDTLTLLSQDGLYMDDLPVEPAPVDLWRRFAQGERGDRMGVLGGIRDEEALELCVSRMREDTIFRDAVHHFLRLFDHRTAEIEPRADDAQLEAWTRTRSAHAFMLLGRAAGIFT